MRLCAQTHLNIHLTPSPHLPCLVFTAKLNLQPQTQWPSSSPREDTPSPPPSQTQPQNGKLTAKPQSPVPTPRNPPKAKPGGERETQPSGTLTPKATITATEVQTPMDLQTITSRSSVSSGPQKPRSDARQTGHSRGMFPITVIAVPTVQADRQVEPKKMMTSTSSDMRDERDMNARQGFNNSAQKNLISHPNSQPSAPPLDRSRYRYVTCRRA